MNLMKLSIVHSVKSIEFRFVEKKLSRPFNDRDN